MKHPVIHELKSWLEFFQAVWDERKLFEIRFNDRKFREGDYVLLSEWDYVRHVATGRKILAEIIYLTEHEQRKGWVVFGTRILRREV